MTEPVVPSTSDQAIWNVWMAAFHAPTLAIADDLGVFRTLAAGPLDTRALADELAIELRATEAIVGLLTGLGFLIAVEGRCALTEIARSYLLPDSPFYWGGMLRRIRDNPLDCRVLISSLRSGRAAEEARLNGMWQAVRPPDAALIAFTHAMHAHCFGLAVRAAALVDAGTALLDVAGGSGGYAIASALRYPALRCTVLDLTAVCGVAAEYAAKHGVADRVRTVAGDMFADPWPRDHDRVLLSDIFHDWDDARCRVLADRAYEALPPGGRVLIHEMLIDDDGLGSLNALSYSMIMVFVSQGRQRTFAEIRDLLGAAGFRDVERTSTANGYSLISATK